MAARSDFVSRRARLLASSGTSWGAAVLAICLPPIFLHVRWQPGVTVHVASTGVSAYLSDFAVLAIAVAALVAGTRQRFEPLRSGLRIWIAALGLLVWIFVAVAYGTRVSSTYPWRDHLVTAAKFAEYAVLAPAVPLLLRARRDLRAPLWSLTLWSIAATAVGVAQFFGAAILIHGGLGGRQGSFLSDADFAALSAAVLVVGLVALLRPDLALGRRLGVAAATSGVVGVVLAAAVASVLGLVTAASAVAVVLLVRRELPARRALGLAAIVVAGAVGVLAMRGGDLSSFARFLRTSHSSPQARQATVQTYSHHTLLVWISFKIWKDHPLLGAGWQASSDPDTFAPYLPAAHRHFPNEPPAAFPTRAHPYSSQNLWVAALAELGVVGLVLLVWVFASVATVAWRATRRGAANPAVLIGLGWTALVAWLWTAQSFVAGIPLDAVTWLGFGLVATGLAHVRTLGVDGTADE